MGKDVIGYSFKKEDRAIRFTSLRALIDKGNTPIDYLVWVLEYIELLESWAVFKPSDLALSEIESLIEQHISKHPSKIHT